MFDTKQNQTSLWKTIKYFKTDYLTEDWDAQIYYQVLKNLVDVQRIIHNI